MKPITRDILLTLLFKFTLLFVLWWVCFHDVERGHLTQTEWLLGSLVQSAQAHSE
ncbi:hypothetical protein Lgee_0228 [Legionella geestiana]|uniref:Uncharacterized protein n=1 Tax=Legionella geestiana TaxID=45065 RepID=A0A0W0U934_9GAMM|nr:cytochrome oxidase putative small subunit CydP [Legionella geestiana]KTD04198.1 hypothetical protein Lgee_0228 [Legionella geestiana]STX53697.1 Uncharacterised protein [Legionella geestiana]